MLAVGRFCFRVMSCVCSVWKPEKWPFLGIKQSTSGRQCTGKYATVKTGWPAPVATVSMPAVARETETARGRARQLQWMIIHAQLLLLAHAVGHCSALCYCAELSWKTLFSKKNFLSTTIVHYSWHTIFLFLTHSVRCNQSKLFFFSRIKSVLATRQPAIIFFHNKSASSTIYSYRQPNIADDEGFCWAGFPKLSVTGPVPVWSGMKPVQIQNLNLNSKKWKISKKFLKIFQGATNLMVSNFLKNSFV